MDSMIALEGKPLASLPWKEIDETGAILILVVPQVMKEIDKHKRDGRLGRRAREFNRIVGPAAETSSAVQISAGPPRVDIAFATIGKINWGAYDDLDPEEGDARVVAQILHAQDVPINKRLLFSHDNNPIAMAARYDLKTKKMPDHWLLEPEPSPHDKELFKLKSRVQELQAQEPIIDTNLTFGVPTPVVIYRIAPLTSAEQQTFIDSILERNRKARQSDPRFTFLEYDSDYDKQYEKYREELVPKHAAQVHRYLEDEYSQVPFTLTVNCAGYIQAENLIVSLRSANGGLHNRFICYPVHGPIAPRPKPNYLSTLNFRNNFPTIKPPAGRHEIEFAIGPDGGEVVEIHCADFRHGRTWVFDGIARINPHSESPFRVSVQTTASNLHGSIDQTFDLEFIVKPANIQELLTLGAGGFIIPIPMSDQVDKALEADNNDWFDFSRAPADSKD